MRSILIYTILFLGFFPFSLIGQEPEKQYSVEELLNLNMEQLLDLDVNVHVTSTRGNNMFNSPSVVSIINREAIVNYNFQTLSEAVQIVSGMMMTRTYLKKNIPTVRGLLQDHYANKILILIDGVPTFNSITGEGILDRISINNVERIEVLKGPASVLYGTNAYAGAINIVLRSEDKQTIDAFAGIGLDNMYTAGMSSRTGNDNFNLYIAGNSQSQYNPNTKFTDEDGISGFIEDQDINQNITLLTSYKTHKLLFNGYNNYEGYLGVTSSFASGAGNPHNASGYLINYAFDEKLGDKFNMNLSLSNDYNMRNLSRNLTDTIHSSIKGQRYCATVQFKYFLNKNFDFDFGGLADYRHSKEYTNYVTLSDQVISDNNMNNKNVVEHSYFGQAQYTSRKLSAVAGMRYTINQMAGGNLSPRLSTVYTFNKTTSVKAICGESFRAPTLFEQFFINPENTVFGNEALLPEISKSLELAFLKQVKFLFFQVLAYNSWQYNKIQRVTSDVIYYGRQYNGINIYKNANDYSAYGVEGEIKYNNPQLFNGFINYNYCAGTTSDEIDSSGHYNFKYVPQHEYSMGLNKSLKNGLFSSVIFNGWASVKGPMSSIPAQYYVDFTLGYKRTLPKYTISHSLSAKNLLDSRIAIPEYVRRNMNEIMFIDGINILYTLRIAVN